MAVPLNVVNVIIITQGGSCVSMGNSVAIKS